MNVPTNPLNAQIPDVPRDFSTLLDGKLIPVSAREAIERENPAYRQVVSRYPHATTEDVSNAVAAARRAADSRIWSGMSGQERHRILARVAELLARNHDELARVEMLEVGRPVQQAKGEIQSSIDNWEYGATLARHMYGDTYTELGSVFGMTLREPVGVIGMVVPWNYPLGSISQKLPFALAAGNTAVIKPSEMTTGTASMLGEILMEAGLPAGVVNIVAGYGSDVGHAIVADPRVDMISFTGSTKVGREIGRLAGESLRRVSLELGGKSAQVVFADADLQAAAQRVAFAIVVGTGQACVAGSRLLVERKIQDEFSQLVFDNMKAIPVGDPFDPKTQVGPMISGAQRQRVLDYVEQGKAQGASIQEVEIDPALADTGYYVKPAMFCGVTPGMVIEQEEIFGPVLAAIPFDTPDEALAIANGTRYGLYGSVWSKDINKAFGFVRRMHAGVVEVNGYGNGAPELPLSGFKESGLGHEKGRHSLDEYTETKTIQITLNPVFKG